MFQGYQEYLQKLLSKPALRGSDLLYSFLADPGDFVAEDSVFGRLLRRGVPLSLRKERGQNLEPFISSFVASTESRIRHWWVRINFSFTGDNKLFDTNYCVVCKTLRKCFYLSVCLLVGLFWVGRVKVWFFIFTQNLEITNQPQWITQILKLGVWKYILRPFVDFKTTIKSCILIRQMWIKTLEDNLCGNK